MHARSAVLQADPQRVDDGIRAVRDEVMPAVLRLDGCVGLSMLCDRDSGRCIVTSSWGSEPARRAAREPNDEVVQRAAAAMGGGDASTDDWEIAVMHRASKPGDDSCARVTWTEAEPAVLADALENLPLTLLSRIDRTGGFCSLSLFVDRGTGRSAATAVYENRQAMEASRAEIGLLREEMAEHMGMVVTGVAEFELPIHHLRVPEAI